MRRKWPLRQWLLFVLEAAAVYPLYAVARLIPLDLGSALGGAIARTVGPRLPMSRAARHTIRLAFPDADAAEVERILVGMYDNYGRVAFEYPHIRQFWEPELLRRVEAEGGFEALRRRVEAGETLTVRGRRIEGVGVENIVRMYFHEGPLVVFCAHLGNFEIMPQWAARLGMPIAALVRVPNNPLVARLIAFIRRGAGELIPKGLEGAVRTGQIMEAGGRLGMLVDQKQNRGIEVPFFGLPAMTSTAAAKLAVRYGCPLFGAWVERTHGAHFRVHVTPPLAMPSEGSADERIRALTIRINEELETWIRQAPEQWLWLHRRWPKTL